MRLIDADALMIQYERIDWYSVSKRGGLMRGATSEDNPVIHYYDGEEVIKNAPTIEAEPVRHGYWENANGRPKTYIRKCSVCGKEAYFCGRGCSYKFCPNCGAKMDGDSHEA